MMLGKLNLDSGSSATLHLGGGADTALSLDAETGAPAAGDYGSLAGKPRIEGVILDGDKTFDDLELPKYRMTNTEIYEVLSK